MVIMDTKSRLSTIGAFSICALLGAAGCAGGYPDGHGGEAGATDIDPSEPRGDPREGDSFNAEPVGRSVAALGAALQHGSASGFSSGGSVTGTMQSVNGGHPGLSGFRFNNKGGDHHVKCVSAVYDCSIGSFGACGASNWNATFTDNSDSTDYWWDMRWQELPVGTDYLLWGANLGAQDEYDVMLKSKTANTVPVLTGFRFMASSDMHVKGLSVTLYTINNELRAYMWFMDKGSGGGTKSIQLGYAEVPAAKAQPLATISGSSGGTERSGYLAANNPVLAGFGMLFARADHHIDRVGAEVAPGFWRVTYEDHNHDDDYLYWLYPVEVLP